MGTITLISLVILALLVGAIGLLIWQRSKGKRIPLAVTSLSKATVAHAGPRKNRPTGRPRLHSVCGYHLRLVQHLPNQ